jgi:hypothetical protein
VQIFSLIVQGTKVPVIDDLAHVGVKNDAVHILSATSPNGYDVPIGDFKSCADKEVVILGIDQ